MGIQNCHYNWLTLYFQVEKINYSIVFDEKDGKNIINLAAILDLAAISVFDIFINRFYTLKNLFIGTKMINIGQ